MSFSMTTDAVRERRKTVTRRLGWAFLQPGDVVRAVEKCMGLKKGETQVPLAVLEVVSVRREALYAMLWQGRAECVREGFPHLTPREFIDMFTEHNRMSRHAEVTRIEFKYLDDPPTH